MSIDRWMDKEAVVRIHNGILLSYKKECIWVSSSEGMKLEPIIQNEVSQKEKHQYSILMHIYGIYKEGNNNPVCETAKYTQM